MGVTCPQNPFIRAYDSLLRFDPLFSGDGGVGQGVGV